MRARGPPIAFSFPPILARRVPIFHPRPRPLVPSRPVLDVHPLLLRSSGRVFDIAFCPWDDRLFASAGEDETARVWLDRGAADGATAHGVCRGHKDEVVRVAWHPTLKILATGSADGASGVWRIAQPGAEESANANDPNAGAIALVDTLVDETCGDEVYGCAFVGECGDGPVLATASGADVRLWDLESGGMTCRATPSAATSAAASAGAVPERWRPGYLFSLASDGGARGLLASGCSDGRVRVYAHDSTAGTVTNVACLPLHANAMVSCTAFLAGGDVLASVSADGVVVTTDVRTMTATRRITAPCPIMGCCAIGGVDGNWLAMCGNDGVVRAMDVTGEGGSKSMRVSESPLLCVAADARGKRIAAAGHQAEAAQKSVGSFGWSESSGGGVFGAKKKPSPAVVHLFESAGDVIF